MKDFIKQFDLFEHVTFLRYQSEPSYRTLTGAIISIITIIIFIGLFSNMFLVVFSKNIITYSKNTFYDADPIYTGLKTDSQEKFMFAIGITGLELNNTQKRYFDISLYNYSIFKNGSRYNQTVKLNGCNISQWQGVNDEIYSLYSKIELNKWLCPPTGFVFPLQGKYTSNTFKYAKIVVQQCGTNGIMYNASTCASKS